ncbi:NAD(P)H-hydrate dehydratase [Methanolobus sp. ZRKC3]|uniref:NAD(P)H-hydrate dehydratase n=1 Tax=Methanolobus sp. ZRKC3 TaxID=3125786 RepID=UPI0032519F50
MDAITSSRMKAIDSNCEYLGMDPLQLMENAGAGIAREVHSRLDTGKVLFIAGRGNNGGDAFVAARHLALCDGCEVKVVLLGRSSQIRTSEAISNFRLLKHSGITEVMEITDSLELDKLSEWKETDIIVDGILGSGVKGSPRTLESAAIGHINDSGSFVISIDVPSGLDVDTGEGEVSVKASVTLTFHRPKKGLLLPNASSFIGELKVIGIGVCRDAEDLVGPGDLNNLKKRSYMAHKGNSGRVLVVGGGAYYGAPALAGLAALRAGADIVTLAVPEGIAATVASFSPDLIVHALSGKRLHPGNVSVVSELIKSHDVIIMGPGLGKEGATRQALKRIVPMCKKAVIDADALHDSIISGKQDAEIILTPHSAELSRLTYENVPEDVEGKKALVLEFSKGMQVVTLLKGNTDIISDGDGVKINCTGNAGMTVGGTGDVLAGIAGALLAANNAMDAASCASFINGAAGDLAFKEKGYGLLATDIIEMISTVMKQEL